MPMDVSFFNRIASFYGERWTIEEENRIVTRSLIPEKDGVLEVGCGNGRLLCNLSGKITGLDTSFEMLRLAQRRVPHARLVQGDATRLPFRRKSFDVLIGVNMLHNHDAPAPFLREFRLMEPRKIIIDFRNNANPVVFYRSRKKSAVTYRPYFRFVWKQILAKNGLSVRAFHPTRRPLSDPTEGFRWRHLIGHVISLLPGLAPCYVGTCTIDD